MSNYTTPQKKKFSAQVIAEAPGVDLALLEVSDKSSFQTSPSLQFFDHLPRAKDIVNVYGYPIGGKELSVTKGIISRIDFDRMFYDFLPIHHLINITL